MSELPKIVIGRLQHGPVSPHPEADLLTAFAEQRLAAAERETVLTHLAACAACRDIVALALPELSETQVPNREPARGTTWRLWQWGAVTAGVVVVAGAVWLNKDLKEQIGYRQKHAEQYRNEAPAAVPPAAEAEPQLKAQANNAPFENKDVPAAADRKRDLKPAESRADAEAVPVITASDTRLYQTLPAKELDQLSLRAAEQGKSQEPSKAEIAAGSVKAAQPGAPAVTANEIAGAAGTTAASGPANTSAPAKMSPTTGYLFRAERVAPPPPALEKKKVARDEKLESASLDQYSLADSSKQNVQIAQSAYAGAQVTVPKDSVPATMRLTADGELQERSDGAPSRWQNLNVKKGDKLRVIALRGQEIWVGGEQGLLYRSEDAGKSWKQVDPGTRGKRIVELRFRDLKHGELKTQDGETWDTEDGGESWAKQD